MGEASTVVASRTAGRSETPLSELVASLSTQQLREIVSAAVDHHDDVARAVRLVAARATGNLGQLRTEVDRGLRTRRFLGYRESMEWARAARPIVVELEAAVSAAPSGALVELLQRAVGHVVKVIQHADDSAGLIGDLARELLALHARACDSGVADPVKLAAWMIRFRFDDQDRRRMSERFVPDTACDYRLSNRDRSARRQGEIRLRRHRAAPPSEVA